MTADRSFSIHLRRGTDFTHVGEELWYANSNQIVREIEKNYYLVTLKVATLQCRPIWTNQITQSPRNLHWALDQSYSIILVLRFFDEKCIHLVILGKEIR